MPSLVSQLYRPINDWSGGGIVAPPNVSERWCGEPAVKLRIRRPAGLVVKDGNRKTKKALERFRRRRAEVA